MYKSGKNWMVAGLMTTAVLAGLTLGNVNTTEAHAAVNNTPVAAAQKTSATSAEIAQASQNVVNTSAVASNANVALSSAQAAFNKANQLNSGVSAVNSAQQAYSQASASLSDAQSAVASADPAATTAYDNYQEASYSAEYGINPAGYGGSAADEEAQKSVNALNDEIKNVQAKLTSDQATLASATAAYNAKSAELASLKDSLQQDLDYWNNQILAAQTAVTAAGADANARQIANNQLTAAQAGYASTQASWKKDIDDVLNPLHDVVSDYTARVNLDHDAVYNPSLGALNYGSGNFNGLNALQKSLKDEQNAVDVHNELVQKANAAEVAYQTAKSAKTLAHQQLSDAKEALATADENVAAVRSAYNLPNNRQLATLKHDDRKASGAVETKKTALEADAGYAAYSAASNALSDAQEAATKAQSAVDAAQQKANQLSEAVAKDTAAVAAATDNAAKATAQAQLAHDQSLLNAANADLTAKQGQLQTAQQKVTSRQGRLQRATTPDLKKKLTALADAKADYQAAHTLYTEALENLKNAASATAAVAEAQAALTQAQTNANAAKKAYNDAVAKYNSLTGEKPATPTYTVNPSAVEVKAGGQLTVTPGGDVASLNATVSFVNGHVNAASEGTTDGVTIVSSKWTDGYDAAQAQVAKAQAELKAANQASKVIYISATYKLSNGQTVVKEVPVTVLNNVTTNPDQPAQGNQGSTTANTGNGEENFTGEKGGKYFVKGQQVSAYQYKEYVAAHPGAVKAAAKGNKKNAATKAKLPQTGNNSAAVVALGALSGMLGLGLAAKKREF